MGVKLFGPELNLGRSLLNAYFQFACNSMARHYYGLKLVRTNETGAPKATRQKRK
jgi:hypothetical protein